MKASIQKIISSFTGLFIAVAVVLPVAADDIEIYVNNKSSGVEVKPNLIFIVDTSGSMRAKVQTQIPYDVKHDYEADGGCFDPDRIYYSTGETPTDCSTDNWFNKDALVCGAAANPLFNTVDPVTSSNTIAVSTTNLPTTPSDVEDTETVVISSVYDEPTDTTTTISQTTEITFNGGNTRTEVTETTEVSTGPALGNGIYQDRMAMWKENPDSSREEWLSFNAVQKDWLVECQADHGKHGVDASSSGIYIANASPGPYVSIESSGVSWNLTGRGYVLYSANYLNWVQVAPLTPVASSPNRLEVVKDVTYNVVDSSNNINIGLMRFDSSSGNGGYQGGPVRYPVEDVTASRNDFKSRLRNFRYGGYTPLSETLYENYLYWAGRDIEYGNISVPSNAVGVAVNGSGNKTYESPIKYTCQKNFNIYLSDGEPYGDGDADGMIQALPGFVDTIGSCTGNCLDELAQYMNTHDIYDLMDDKQTVATYTVGFAIDHDLLKSTAVLGGAKYYKADNAAELTEIFNKIIAEILSINTTFSSPAVSINAFNRATHRSDLYFTLFKPNVTPHWDGNLKRFKLEFDVDGLPVIVDKDGADAINNITGFFKDDARSYWLDNTSDPDGGEVTLGGAAARIDARKVYTYTGSTPANNEDLTVTVNEFHENNSALTLNLLGIPTQSLAYRTSLIQWARGIDIFDDDGDGDVADVRQFMGDPLHAEPALIQYGGTDADPDITAYVATNDGVLHAINTATGEELFSFIPQELLPLQKTIYEDQAGDGKAYGIDGSVASLVIDENEPGVIDGDDKVYIFFGQRRGGNHYFAMDVTNRNSPKLMWVINGGVGDFAELSNTWSNIQVKRLLVKGNEIFAGVFGGGYDIDQDSHTTRTVDDIGRAVYIVDAMTGERLWWAGGTGSGADLEMPFMDYSIPGKLTAVDVRQDGYLDRMYFGDMGGQLWRIDILPGRLPSDGLSTITSGQRLADLADNTSAGNRRFFYSPDVAFIAEEGAPPYLSLAVASGYRAHPLNTTIEDRIYMIKDTYLYTPPPINAYGSLNTGVIVDDLYDASENFIGQGNTTEKEQALQDLESRDGWFIKLDEPDGSYIGEKGLSELLIIDGLIVATTYIPPNSGSAVACEPTDGSGYVYFMSVTDATPKYNFDTVVDASDNLTAEDRRTKLTRGGVPPNPAPIFTKDGSAIIVGTEPVKNPNDDRPKKLFWYEDEKKN